MALMVEDRVQFILLRKGPIGATQESRKKVMEITERLGEWALSRWDDKMKGLSQFFEGQAVRKQ